MSYEMLVIFVTAFILQLKVVPSAENTDRDPEVIYLCLKKLLCDRGDYDDVCNWADQMPESVQEKCYEHVAISSGLETADRRKFWKDVSEKICLKTEIEMKNIFCNFTNMLVEYCSQICNSDPNCQECQDYYPAKAKLSEMMNNYEDSGICTVGNQPPAAPPLG